MEQVISGFKLGLITKPMLSMQTLEVHRRQTSSFPVLEFKAAARSSV